MLQALGQHEGCTVEDGKGVSDASGLEAENGSEPPQRARVSEGVQRAYSVLGLQPGASMAEVKRAYRRVQRETHPDKEGPRGGAAFMAAGEAYERIVAAGPAPVSGGAGL